MHMKKAATRRCRLFCVALSASETGWRIPLPSAFRQDLFGRYGNLGYAGLVAAPLERGAEEGFEHPDRLVVGDEAGREDDDVGDVVAAAPASGCAYSG